MSAGIDSRWISLLSGTISFIRLIDFPEKVKTILTEYPDFFYDLNGSESEKLSGPVNMNPDWKDRIYVGPKSILRTVVEKDDPDHPLLELLLSSDKVDINLLETDQDDMFLSSFMWVCGTNKKALAEKFLRCPKLDINQEAYTDHYKGYTTNALYEALANRHWDIAKLILDHPNIDPNKSFGSEGETPLFKCVYGENTEGVKLLLTHPKIDVNKESNYHMKGRTPLFVACQRGLTDVVQLLLDNGADPTIQMQELSSTGRGWDGSINRTVRDGRSWDLLDYMKELSNPVSKERYLYKSWYKKGLPNYPVVISILETLNGV